MTRPSTVSELGQVYWPSSDASPFITSEEDETSLKVEPGAYSPAIAREISGSSADGSVSFL